MKKLILISLLFIGSCFPSMQTGPDQHSIEFEEKKFEEVITYFKANPRTKGFKVDTPPSEIPETTKDLMIDLGILEFRNLGNHKAFFCGYGVVGKGWGFIYGDFNEKEIERPELVQVNNNQLYLTYLQHIKGKWYRFGSG